MATTAIQATQSETWRLSAPLRVATAQPPGWAARSGNTGRGQKPHSRRSRRAWV